MKIYDAISINKDSLEPMYIQLYGNLKRMIENGTLERNTKLPPIRSLASQLGVNNITVINAYKLLEQNGYALSRIGSGTYVKGIGYDWGAGGEFSNMDIKEQTELSSFKSEINFYSSTPNPKLFPVKEFKEILNEVLERDGGYAFGYQESQGYMPLRESIGSYLFERGIETSSSDIHIISGAQQGIDIISKVLIKFNDTIVVESPTYTGALAAFKSRGANIVEVPMLEDGIDTIELENVLKGVKPKLIYVMTSYQNPTGVSYNQDKKLQLLYLAQKYDTYILEDEYLSELNFYKNQEMPVKALDANNRIIYLKSFSKIFMPGIRLGFLITPEQISSRVLSAKHTTDISTSSLMQRAFDLYLRKRKWQGHMEMMREVYKKRYDTMIKEMKDLAPFIEFKEPFGGIHIWCRTEMDSLMLYSCAKERGLLIAPGRHFYLDERQSNFFRISYAGVEEDAIKKGIEILADAYNYLTSLK